MLTKWARCTSRRGDFHPSTFLISSSWWPSFNSYESGKIKGFRIHWLKALSSKSKISKSQFENSIENRKNNLQIFKTSWCWYIKRGANIHWLRWYQSKFEIPTISCSKIFLYKFCCSRPDPCESKNFQSSRVRVQARDYDFDEPESEYGLDLIFQTSPSPSLDSSFVFKTSPSPSPNFDTLLTCIPKYPLSIHIQTKYYTHKDCL